MSNDPRTGVLRLFRADLDKFVPQIENKLAAIPPGGDQTLSAQIRSHAKAIRSSAKLSKLDEISQLAQALEERATSLGQPDGPPIEATLALTSLLSRLRQEADFDAWLASHRDEVVAATASLRAAAPATAAPAAATPPAALPPTPPAAAPPAPQPSRASAPLASPGPPVNIGLLGLFRQEVEAHLGTLSQEINDLDGAPLAGDRINVLMRAAHSLKGAARIVGLMAAVGVCHAIEDYFLAIKNGQTQLDRNASDALLEACDQLHDLARLPDRELIEGFQREEPRLRATSERLAGLASSPPRSSPEIPEKRADLAPIAARPQPRPPPPHPTKPPPPQPQAQPQPQPQPPKPQTLPPQPRGALVSPQKPSTSRAHPAPQPAPTPGPQPRSAALLSSAGPPAAEKAPASEASGPRVLRIGAESLERIMGLSGEAMVRALRLAPINKRLSGLREHQERVLGALEAAQTALGLSGSPEVATHLATARQAATELRASLIDSLLALEEYGLGGVEVTERLHEEVLSSRLRPFSEGAQGLARMGRDVARQLGKLVRVVLSGGDTMVDRDVLEKLDAPLGHLVRNAIDHGLETAVERLSSGKTEAGTVSVAASQRAGMLVLEISDDGRGIDPEVIRSKAVERGLIAAELAAALSSAEIFEFLFLPGFSTARQVTHISGRGVGLDAVRSGVDALGGNVRLTSQKGQGTTFHIEVPLARSVLRVVLVEIAREPYAMPLARVGSVRKLPTTELLSMENRQYVHVEGRNVAVVSARQLFDIPEEPLDGGEVSLVVLGDRLGEYAVVIDRILGEQDLAIRHLDPRLGVVQDVSAAALLEDGSPILVLDPDSMLRSIDAMLDTGRLRRVSTRTQQLRRVLVVDDSLTVREAERQLLLGGGYDVDVAVDGLDGWTQLRKARYDLLVTDIDMPRMNGFELVRMVRADPQLRALPIIIVSYKDREEDRLQGLQAGADAYLTKGSFQDQTLLRKARELIGGPTP